MIEQRYGVLNGHCNRQALGTVLGGVAGGVVGHQVSQGDAAATAIGTVVNLAARLCGQAQGGEVLAAERVVAALGDTVVSEPAGEIELKGMARPVAIHRVTSLA